MNFGFNEDNYQPKEKTCACSPAEQPMTFAEMSFRTYQVLSETDDILDKIADLMEGKCHKVSEDMESPMCLSQNISDNHRLAVIVRDRVRSLAIMLGIKDI